MASGAQAEWWCRRENGKRGWRTVAVENWYAIPNSGGSQRVQEHVSPAQRQAANHARARSHAPNCWRHAARRRAAGERPG